MRNVRTRTLGGLYMTHEHKSAGPIAWIFALMAFVGGFATVAASAEDLGTAGRRHGARYRHAT